MNLKRTGAVLGLATLTAVGLTACSDENSSSDSGDKGGQVAAPSNVDCEGKTQLKASGSTAQTKAMDVFKTSFSTSCDGGNVDYTASGSGTGITDFTNNLTDFAGSDSPLKEEEAAKAKARCGSDAMHIPAVFGPIAVGYKLDGVTDLALSGPMLAKIFKGEITKWNDPAIAAENQGKTLPDKPVKVVFRNGESGTTDNFQKYLASASDGAWEADKSGKAFKGGTGEGVEGSNGVADAVSKSDGAIGYMEWSFAKASGAGVADIITSAGPEPVKLSAETAGKTIDGAKLKKEGTNDLVLDTSSFYKPSATGAYPIILATYEIVCSKYSDEQTAKGVKAFLKVATDPEVQKGVVDQGFVPVPDAFATKLKTAVDSIS